MTHTMSPLNLPRKELRYIKTQIAPIEMSEKLRPFLLAKNLILLYQRESRS